MSLLQKGDTVGFVATSSGLEGRDISPAINYFEQELNLKVKLAPNLASACRYMAGTDEERAAALTEMYRDSEIKALFAIRGAAGSSRMLKNLDYTTITQNPKPLFGLSDVTAVQNALFAKSAAPSYTGFLPVYDIRDGKVNPELETSLKNVLFADSRQISGGVSLISGTAEGKIIGGCLTSFLYLAGTEYLPDFKDKILLLEDTDEKTYKIDLMMSQLKQQKNFNRLKGIIIGSFTDCTIVDSFDGDISDCVADFVKDLQIPVITGFSYGHTPARSVVPLGFTVRMISSPAGCSLNW